MKPGRNDPCPCGSGKKYKACCQGREAHAAANAPARESIDAARLLSLFNAGQHAPLESELHRLTRLHPQSSFLWSLLGATLQMQGKEGLAALQKATALAPNDAQAHLNLGTALQHGGRFDEAEASYRRALAISPNTLRASLNLGSLLLDRQRLESAEACFREVLRVDQGLAEALVGLGNVLARSGRLDEAESSLRKVLQADANAPEAYFCLGNLQRERGQMDAAMASYRACLKVFPGFAPACNNLGSVQLELGAVGDAVDSLQQALRIAPDYGEAHINLAQAFVDLNRFAQAEASYRRAVQIMPLRADLHGKLGLLQKEMGDVDAAQQCYRRQLELDPDSAEARIALAILKLPIAPADASAAARAAGDFGLALDELSSWLGSDPSREALLASAVGAQQPFYLAYRQGNHAALLARYGDLAARCACSGLPPGWAADGESPRAATKIRLVVVSNQIRRHSVWDIVLKGLVTHLDRSRFEVILYHTGVHEDEQTALARTLADGWRDRRGAPQIEHLLASIRADRPDVILYPEIGMDPFSFRLAAHRLARLQIASWGHPISSGLPTIDWFLSGQLLEGADADEHYRERLVRLPGTGCCTTPLDFTPQPLGDVEDELRHRRGPRFVIAQRAFKFDPADDALYAQIAAAVGECTFVLLKDPVYPWASSTVMSRLRQAFAERGLDSQQYLLEIPWLASEQFVTLLDVCDVFLDCPAFSGYTTAWQALHRGLPLVTLEGALLRQRLAAGLLRKIGRPEMVVQSRDDYVALAVALAGAGVDRKRALRESIRHAAAAADGDIGVVRAFEALIVAELAPRVNPR